MISSIFYFADTEQEYLDNFNRHQVKPYTIVFCKDTRSVWKNGVRYGGSTSSEVGGQIDDIIDSSITPLLQQLNDAIQQAGDAADRAEGRLSEVSTQMDNAINDLQNAIDTEKTRLDNKVAEINDDITNRIQGILDDYQDLVDNFDDNVADKIEGLLADAEWVQENMPQAEVTWNSTWDQNVDNRMLQAGYWDIDPETGEKTTKWSKLQQSVDGISTEVGDIVEGLGGDINATYTKITQSADTIASQAEWIQEAEGVINTHGSLIEQTPTKITNAVNSATTTLNGTIQTAKSEAIQTATSIVQAVTGVTPSFDGSTYTITGNTLAQRITDEGAARTEMGTQWVNANAETQKVLEWMYSGLTTEAGDNKTFTELTAAAQDGDHSAISNIMNLVEKIPVYQTDPQTGDLLEDEHGNYIPVTDNNGNVVYQTNPDGSFKYKAKASLTSAVDDALSGLITSATSDKAGAELISSLDNQVAALTLLVGDGESSLEGLVTTDNFASELSLVASDQWANTTLATKLRVPKTDDNGDPIYDDHGNPVYEDVADVLGAMRSTIEVLDGGPQVTNSIDAKVNDAISTFEQKVNDGEACTTLVNKVNNDSNVLSGLVSKVTGDSSSATMMAKVNNMTAGVATKADLNGALAGLIAGGTMIKLVPIDPVEGFSKTVIVNGQTRTVDIPEGSSYGDVEALYANVYEDINEYELLETYSAYPSTIIFEKNSNGNYVRESHVFTPSEFAELWRNVSCGGTRLRYEGDTNTSTTGYTTIRIGDVIADDMMEPWYIDTTSIEAGVMTKVDNKIGTATANLVSQSSLSLTISGVYTEVDARIGTATAKLVAKNEFTSAGVIAKVNGNDSNVRIYGKSILLDGDVYMQDAFVQNLCANSLFTSEITALNNQNLTINATDIDFKVPGQSEAKISIDATTGTLRAQEVEIGGIINASSLYRSYAIINLGAYGEELGSETEGTYINIPEFYGPNGAGYYYNIPEFENNALPDIIKFDISQTANNISANSIKPSGNYYSYDQNYFIKFPSPSLCPGRLIEIYFKRRLDYNYNWSDQLKFSSSNYRRTPGVVLDFPGGNYSEFSAYAEPIIYDPTSTTELYSKRDGTWFGGSLNADDWWGYIRVISKDGQWIVLDAKNCRTYYPYL